MALLQESIETISIVQTKNQIHFYSNRLFLSPAFVVPPSLVQVVRVRPLPFQSKMEIMHLIIYPIEEYQNDPLGI